MARTRSYRHQPADDCPTGAVVGRSSAHHPATRCVRSVEISTVESLRIFGESEAQSRCTSPTGANRGLSSDPGGAARSLVIQNSSAALVSGAEPYKRFHQAII